MKLKYKDGGVVKLQNAGVIPLGGDYLEYLYSVPEIYGGTIQPSVKVEKLPEKFHSSQRAARNYAEGYKASQQVTRGINNAGNKIYNVVDTATAFMPGPVGVINWLGHTGADLINGEYSKVGKDLAFAAGLGLGAKAVGKSVYSAGKELAGRGVNIPFLDNNTYSKLRSEYFSDNFDKIHHFGPLRHAKMSEVPLSEFVTKDPIPEGTRVFNTKLIDTLTGHPVGEMFTSTYPNGESKVNWIEAFGKYEHWAKDAKGQYGYVPHWLHRKVGRGLYNAQIPNTRFGLDSGWDVLLEPEKTKATWRHFQFKPLEKGVRLLRQENFVPTLENKIIATSLPIHKPIKNTVSIIEPYKGNNYIWHKTPLYKEQIIENETRAMAPSLGISRIDDLEWTIAANRRTPATLYSEYAFIEADKNILNNSIIFNGDGNTPTVYDVTGKIDYIPSRYRERTTNWILNAQNAHGFNTTPKLKIEDLNKQPIGNQEYFEAKYQGLLPLETFKYGLFPEGKRSVPFINFFKNKGLNVKLYSPEIEGDYENVLLEILKNDPSILFKQGGIIKAQNGFLNTWQKAYNSKFGKGLRDFMFGKDSNLSDEEYAAKHGYNKPVGGLGVLGAVVAPEWGLLDAAPVAENFGRNTGFVEGVPKAAQLEPTLIKNVTGSPMIEPVKELSDIEKFFQRSVREQDDIVRMWNGENYSGINSLKANKKDFEKFLKWLKTAKKKK